jgi:hypothetical protein
VHSLRRLLPVFVSLAASAALQAETPYHINVQSEPRQTFQGFGASQVSKEFGHFSPEPHRSEMADLVYRDLKANILRLWVQSGPEHSVSAMKEAFYADYVDNGVIALIAERGPIKLLLAPARGPDTPKDSLPAYAEKLATFIAEMKAEKNIDIAVTGIANEPDWWTGPQLAETIKALRAELDVRNLKNVEIIAPEGASANEILDAQLDAIRADTKAWEALSGIASHSYNMAARDSAAERAHGKAYWMTEACDDGNEHGEDENRAATISARFLNDMNHLVTHWIYFKGFSYSPDVTTDDYTASRLSQFDGKTGEIVTNFKYYYLKALRDTFDLGATFRRCESEAEADMVYTYGQKPKVCAAAGVNPDGTWGIGIVNLTGVVPDTNITEWHPAEEITVTMEIPELKDSTPQSFRLHRVRAGRAHGEGELVQVKRGSLSVKVAPRELVCLRSEIQTGRP